MNAEDALTYMEGAISLPYLLPGKKYVPALDTLRECVEACERAEQTLRNLATGFLTGDCAEIAHNEAGNLHNALKGG